MREIRPYGSEGGGAVCSPYPYPSKKSKLQAAEVSRRRNRSRANIRLVTSAATSIFIDVVLPGGMTGSHEDPSSEADTYEAALKSILSHLQADWRGSIRTSE